VWTRWGVSPPISKTRRIEMVRKPEEKGGVSLDPSTFTEGTGLLNDVDAEWKECKFVMWDYNKRIREEVPALMVALQTDDELVEQYWSAGNAKDWVPSSDGKRLLPIGLATTINKASNMAHLMGSLVEAGFPRDKIQDDISVFEGMLTHMIRIPAPKRPGLKKAPRADGREYEETILVVDSIKKMPWEAEEKAAAKGKKGPPKGAREGDPVYEKAVETVGKILKEHGPVDKKQLASLAFNELKTDADRNAIVQLVYKDDFLQGGPWQFEDGMVVPQEE